jgi:hypothetical protein
LPLNSSEFARYTYSLGLMTGNSNMGVSATISSLSFIKY